MLLAWPCKHPPCCLLQHCSCKRHLHQCCVIASVLPLLRRCCTALLLSCAGWRHPAALQVARVADGLPAVDALRQVIDRVRTDNFVLLR